MYRAQIRTLTGCSDADIDALLGPGYDGPDTRQPDEERGEWTKEALGRLALDALGELLTDAQRNPGDFKPSERLAIISAALDRGYGKPGQTIEQSVNVRVTAHQLAAMPPDEAYKMLIAEPVDVIDAEVIDTPAGGLPDFETEGGGGPETAGACDAK